MAQPGSIRRSAGGSAYRGEPDTPAMVMMALRTRRKNEIDMTSMSPDRMAARLKVVDEHVRLENHHDLEGIMGTFGATAHYDDEP
jgi:hypothetical protein